MFRKAVIPQSAFQGFGSLYPCSLAKMLELISLSSSPTSTLSSHFDGLLTICSEASNWCEPSNRITSPCSPASSLFQIQNVIYVHTSLRSPLQLHLSHSHGALLNTNLGPYWARLKVQRAICHAVQCSRQNVERLFIKREHSKQPGERLTTLGLSRKLLHLQGGTLVLICHWGHRAQSGCLALMDRAGASVLTLPSICGCTALKTDKSCWGEPQLWSISANKSVTPF